MPRPRFGRRTETGGKVHRTRANAPPAGTGRKSGLPAAGAAVPAPTHSLGRGRQRHPHCPAQPAAATSRGAGAAGSSFRRAGIPLYYIGSGAKCKSGGPQKAAVCPRRKKGKAALPAAPLPPDCRRERAVPAAAEGKNFGAERRALSGGKKQGLDKQRKRGYSEYTPPRGRGARRF